MLDIHQITMLKFCMMRCIGRGVVRESKNSPPPKASSFGNHPHLVLTYCLRASSSGLGLQPDSLETFKYIDSKWMRKMYRRKQRA